MGIEFVTSIKDYNKSEDELDLWAKINNRLDNDIMCEKIRTSQLKYKLGATLDSKSLWQIAAVKRDPIFLLELEKNN